MPLFVGTMATQSESFPEEHVPQEHYRENILSLRVEHSTQFQNKPPMVNRGLLRLPG